MTCSEIYVKKMVLVLFAFILSQLILRKDDVYLQDMGTHVLSNLFSKVLNNSVHNHYDNRF